MVGRESSARSSLLLTGVLLVVVFQFENQYSSYRQMANADSLTRIHKQPKHVFWSSDFHIAPIADIKLLLEGFGMEVIDKSMSGHCHLKGTCANDIKVSLLTFHICTFI